MIQIPFVYKAIFLSAISLGLVGTGVYGYKSYADAKAEVVESRKEIQSLKDNLAILKESSNDAKIHLESLRKTEADSAKLVEHVSQLRKSIQQLKLRATASPEACAGSVAVVGEVFGECTERYSSVARKAELLQSDLKALDSFANRIIPLSGERK